MILSLVLDLAAVPASEELARGEAGVLARMGQGKAAWQGYESLVRADSANAVAWTRKGQLLEELNKFEAAVDAYKAATSADANDGDAWTGLGDALYALERYEEAVEAYDRAIAIDPRDEIAWNNIGTALNKMGRHAASLKYHDKSLEIKPDFDYALYAKGHALDSLGRHEEGLELISQSLELNPNYDHAWMAKAESLHHLGRLEEARDSLNNALILNGAFDEAWVFRGQILEEMGNAFEAERCYEEALQCFRASLELEPENAELRYSQGVLLEDLERVEEAIDAYAGAASRTHGAGAIVRFSAILLRVGRATDALAPAGDACSRHPSDSRGWLAAGRASSALGRDADAEAAFRKAVELGAAEGRLELARTLRHLGRASDALTILDGMDSSDTEASLLRADLHEDLGRAEDALSAFSAALRISADGRDVVYRRKGGLLLRLDRPKEALAAFDAALGLNPTDPGAWFDAARAWRALGQEGRARKMLDQALRLDPGFPRALDLRSERTASS